MSELVDKDAFLKQERKWYCENCDRRKGVKNGRKCFVYEIGEAPFRACDVDDVLDDLECFETIDVPRWHRVEDEPRDGQECIDLMRKIYGDEAVRHFCICNAYKYRFRAGAKQTEAAQDDIKKAEWYEQYVMEHIPQNYTAWADRRK